MRLKDDNYIPDDPNEDKTKHGRAMFFFFQRCSDIFALPATYIFLVCDSPIFAGLCLIGALFTWRTLWTDIHVANERGLVPCPNCGYAQKHGKACPTPNLVPPKATKFPDMVRDVLSYGSVELKSGIWAFPAGILMTLVLFIAINIYM